MPMNPRKSRVEDTSEAIAAARLAGTGSSQEASDQKIQMTAIEQLAYSSAFAADQLYEIKTFLLTQLGPKLPR